MPGIDINAELGESPWIASDRDGVLRNLQRYRLDGMIVASRRSLAGDVAGGNAELKAALEGQANLFGWITVSTAHVGPAAEEMRRYGSGRNFAGLRLDFPTSQHRLFSDATMEILNGFRRYTKPALVPVRDAADVRDLEQVAKAIPTIKFIAAGAGGDAWTACGALADRVVNIMLEPFSGGYHVGKIEALTGLLGAHRILFGSGYPAQNTGAAGGLLGDAKIGESEKQAILKGNAVRLFGLGPAPPSED